mgnify:CR=1|jgi:8-oxo-dGTP pyrophosphatase MutT (NUDIX family)
MCKHNTCAQIWKAKGNAVKLGGVSALIVNPNYVADGVVRGVQVLLGKEVAGQYVNQYNLPGGKMDTRCFLDELIREVREEAKIDLSYANFDAHFRIDGKINWFLYNTTPIFIGIFPGLSTRKITQAMQLAIKDPSVPTAEKEMSDAKWFDLDCNSFQGQFIISPYSRAVITKLKQLNFFFYFFTQVKK